MHVAMDESYVHHVCIELFSSVSLELVKMKTFNIFMLSTETNAYSAQRESRQGSRHSEYLVLVLIWRKIDVGGINFRFAF